jgi:N-acylneuraminate cytidylyltransferase
MLMRVDAVILARGGSKGIPKKNIKLFCGKPLMYWSIDACQKSRHVNRVFVSSDDLEILALAEEAGAELIRRPVQFSSDRASSESAWLHAIDELEALGCFSDYILAPQVTSPIREEGDIDGAIETCVNQQLDSLFSASLADDLFMWKKNHAGDLQSWNFDYQNRERRQDYKADIIENGSFYLFSPSSMRVNNNRIGGNFSYYVMKFWKAFEVDDLDDWKFCELVMQKYILEGKKN